MSIKLNFKGVNNCISDGLLCLQETVGYEICDDGFTVKLYQIDEGLDVQWDGKNAAIGYSDKTALFRSLAILCAKINKNDFSATHESKRFITNGFMADCSRNHVLSMSGIKSIMRYMATMGLNFLMLYTEDTYEVENQPYFGYMRGRYTPEEIIEIDNYADMLGIELVPCIQTLGHLERLLQWSVYGSIKDNDSVLLVDEGKTYSLIKDMLLSVSKCYRSKRVHIGMDETWGLGHGRYLEKHGLVPMKQIFMKHLQRVVEIAEEIGLEPIMWGDMFFTIAAEQQKVPLDNYEASSVKSGGNPMYYNLHTQITDDIRDQVPNNVGVVYWDYYTLEEENYIEFIKKHKQLSNNVIFCGGFQNWVGMALDFEYMYTASFNALNACRKEGVKEVFAAAWQDDGAETDVFQVLPGMQLYAEMGWSDKVNEEHLKQRFYECTGGNWDYFKMLGDIDMTPGRNKALATRVSKWLLYNDPSVGLYDYHIEGLPLNEYYKQMAEKLLPACDGKWGWLFKVPQQLCDVLSLKSELGVKIIAAYKEDNRTELANIAENIIPAICDKMEVLIIEWEKQWHYDGKMFGWEVVNLRLGGTTARLKSASRRINDYLQGDIERLEEYEETRLPINGDFEAKSLPPVAWWHKFVSPGIV